MNLNLSKEEMMNRLDEILTDSFELETHDCMVAVFSSHGNISQIDDKYCQPVYIDEIVDKFSNANCPGLANKPKIFIFLSCRGGNPFSFLN